MWIIVRTSMETNNKNLYEAPAAESVAVRFEGNFCDSPAGVQGRKSYEPVEENPFGDPSDN
jgi:hypothetical protein